MTGQLFTHYFLTDGIRATPEWQASAADPEAFASFRQSVLQRYETLARAAEPNEAVTEQDLIRPVLELLGWADYLPQQRAAGNEDIPDHLLFADAGSKERASAERNAAGRARYALAVEESKRFGLSLDERDREAGFHARSPHSQILRYLATAEIESESRLRWGVLTNGRVWRLYDYRARPRASGYFEADLADLLEPRREEDLRVFHLLFRRESFTPQEGAAESFLEAALAEGRRYEEQVAQDLSGVVFESVFPALVQALADAAEKRGSGASLPEVHKAALIFLYRLLFVLYAEDRGLLPVNDSRYDDYGLRKRVRDDVAHRMEESDTFSAVASNYYDRLLNLFRIIDQGDPSIGLPPYNGGLFARDAAPLLEAVRLADAEVAPLIHDLSHAEDLQGERHFVNYRDMSVQQLGSIYERLLEREPVQGGDGIEIRPNPYARKDSGSFYTPQELVDLIVERTLKPLAEERLKAFEEKADALKSDRRPKAQRQAELLTLDPAEAVLDLKVLDPAMGSGHFLVTAVDFLSDYIADLVEYVPAVPEWLGGEYASPLVGRVAAIREEILRRAEASDWVLDEAQLTDQAIIRRMVLKRCIYGVDKNPLTVELAKVSLWLHSFTVGAPLSFLDHHLRCGDSLVGLRVSEAVKDLHRLAEMFAQSAIQGAETATEGMHQIEEMSDADVAEVQASAELFSEVEKTTADLRGLLDILCGWRWLTAGMKKKERAAFEGPLEMTLGRHPAEAFKLLARGPGHLGNDPPKDKDWPRFVERWSEARALADREGFLHWEAAFPGVWRRWQESRPQGGFDAVIGNPPWDRIKLQEVEWFATRDSELALAPTAAARRKGIQRLRKQGSPLASEFDAAREQAESLARMVRSCGDYPLLGGGDVNLYSLFVERATALIKPDGFVGLLTPSGIYADKTAAPFFKSLSTGGRVGGRPGRQRLGGLRRLLPLRRALRPAGEGQAGGDGPGADRSARRPAAAAERAQPLQQRDRDLLVPTADRPGASGGVRHHGSTGSGVTRPPAKGRPAPVALGRAGRARPPSCQRRVRVPAGDGRGRADAQADPAALRSEGPARSRTPPGSGLLTRRIFLDAIPRSLPHEDPRCAFRFVGVARSGSLTHGRCSRYDRPGRQRWWRSVGRVVLGGGVSDVESSLWRDRPPGQGKHPARRQGACLFAGWSLPRRGEYHRRVAVRPGGPEQAYVAARRGGLCGGLFP